MALIERVYRAPTGVLHLVVADESMTEPVPDEWVFVPGGVETFFAENHAAAVATQDMVEAHRAAFLLARQEEQANRAAVFSALATAAGIDPAALIAAVTTSPETWLVPPADQLSLSENPLLASQVNATGVWTTPDSLTVTVTHKQEAAGLNTVYTTLTVDAGLGTESTEILTLVPGGSEIRTVEGATTLDLREGDDGVGRLLARWQPSAGSTPAWAPVPVADDPASNVRAAASVDQGSPDPPGETVIRPTRRPRQTGRPDNASPTA